MRLNRIFIVIILISLITPFFVQISDSQIPSVFSLNLLTPNTDPHRNQWALLMERQLPKIGIKVDILEFVDDNYIPVRTWDYPFVNYDYIPTYTQGGYDILFHRVNWETDWDPSGLYDSRSICPAGDNFYQYNNSAYDNLLKDYLNETDQTAQIELAHSMQEILYEEIPAISILYPDIILGYSWELLDFNPQLLLQGMERYETWVSYDSNATYAIPKPLSEWNYYRQESRIDLLWMQGIYGRLFQRSQDLKWVPQIAADFPETAENHKLISVEINPLAQFSDGSPVLPEDVVYSLQLHLAEEVESTHSSEFKKWFASNSSVYAIGNTVYFNMTDVNPFPLTTLSYPIIDKSSIEPLISTYGLGIFDEVPLTGNISDNLVKSCGPFILEEFNTTISTTRLVPNPYYWNFSSTVPELKNLYFTYVPTKEVALEMLEVGILDVVDYYFTIVTEDFSSEFDLAFATLLAEEEMAVNMRHPVIGTGELTPIGTPDAARWVRKAISHATPRDIIVSQIMSGFGREGITPCPPSSPAYNNDLLHGYAYDMDTALAYMELAGFEVYYYEHHNGSYLGIILIAILVLLGVAVVTIILASKSIKNKRKYLNKK